MYDYIYIFKCENRISLFQTKVNSVHIHVAVGLQLKYICNTYRLIHRRQIIIIILRKIINYIIVCQNSIKTF